MNFFRVTFLLCTKISALPQLMPVPAWRVALHTLLILLICPAFLATVLTGADSESRRQTTDDLFRETGGLIFRGNELALGSGAAEQHLSFTMIHPAFLMRRGACRFDFISDTGGKKYPDPEWREKVGVTATPHILFFWERYDDRYKLVSVPSDFAKLCLMPEKATQEDRDKLYDKLAESLQSVRILDAAECQREIAERLSAAKTEPAQPQTEPAQPQTEPAQPQTDTGAAINPDWFGRQLTLFLWMNFFILYFQEGLALMLFSSLIFALIQKFRFRLFPKRLSYGMIFKLMLYCAFPAMLAAAFLRACQDTFEFQTIFFLAFFICQLLGFNFLIRQMNPERVPEAPDDDDDF